MRRQYRALKNTIDIACRLVDAAIRSGCVCARPRDETL
jgi:hypothetical protein